MDAANEKSAAAGDLRESLLNADSVERALLDEEEPRTWTTGEQQPSQYRDVPFALLFLLQLLVVLGLAIGWGFSALKYEPSGDTQPIEFSGFLYICLISGVAALLISFLAIAFMTKYARFLVQFSVLFSMFSSLLLVIIFGFQGSDEAALMAFVFFAISACYAWAIWHRIPFAASNLTTALSAIRSNLGVAVVGYGLTVVAFGWTLLWTISLIGVYVRSADCHEGVCQGGINGGIIFLFLLSFYWTQQVIKVCTL